MREPIRVLHVDDDPDFTDLVATALEREDDRLIVETATGVDEQSACGRRRRRTRVDEQSACGRRRRGQRRHERGRNRHRRVLE
jgi:CheY-like chemotaxis protein